MSSDKDQRKKFDFAQCKRTFSENELDAAVLFALMRCRPQHDRRPRMNVVHSMWNTWDIKVYSDCAHVMEYISMLMTKKTEVGLKHTYCMMCTVRGNALTTLFTKPSAARIVSDKHSGRQSQIRGLWTFSHSTGMVLFEAGKLRGQRLGE